MPVVQTLHNYRFICPGALLMRDGHPCEDCVGTSLTARVAASLLPWVPTRYWRGGLDARQVIACGALTELWSTDISR